jgi:oligopeptide/dipeptide ABC transporter ATP-binding protein
VSAGCEVRGLTVATTRRPPLVLVERVDVALAPGEVMGIVGETGAGKTLTMRAILGLLPGGISAEGELALGGQTVRLSNLARLHSLLGAQTSMVFQNPVGMLDPMMRVGDQLIEGVVRRRIMTALEARERAGALLSQMGFRDPLVVERLYPHELSGGMAQRVATAMAMMPRPRILILDEPTSALDANVRVEVLRLFRRLAQQERTAVFLVSHDLGVVSHFCDSMAVMYAGRVVESGSTADILTRPAHPYTGALLACSATLLAPNRSALLTISGAPPRPGEWPLGCVFSPRCPRAAERCREERPRLEPKQASAAACHYPLRRPAA